MERASLPQEEHGTGRGRRGKGGKWLMDREMFIGGACHHHVGSPNERRNRLAIFLSSASRASCRRILR